MNPRFIPLALIALTLVGGCVDRKAQAQAKETAGVINNPVAEVVAQPASTKTLQKTVVVTGDVTTSDDTQVGPKASGRVISVLVEDGDQVSAGQVIAQLDTANLVASLQQSSAQEAQARAALSQAFSALSQARNNQAFNPAKSTAAIRSAQAQLRSAQANLAKVRAGARPQERLQAQAQVASAKANLDTQQKQLDRIRTLVKEGAIAGSQLDTQEATYEAARTTYQNAVQALGLIQEGNRTEDILAAQEGVRVAQETVQTAKSNKSLDVVFNDQVANAKAQVQAAQAQIAAAQAVASGARQNLADATIRAPFAGTVSGRPVQPGTVVAPGTAIVRLVGGQGIYFEGSVPSDQINSIRPGQSVSIAIDALNGRTFPGTVRTVGTQGSSVGRLFTARIAFVGAPTEVRPGMFARGTIVLKTISGATVLPSTAVLKDEDGSYVMTAQSGKAKRIAVQPGFVQGEDTEVDGLPVGAQVIVKGQTNLNDGAQVKTVKE